MTALLNFKGPETDNRLSENQIAHGPQRESIELRNRLDTVGQNNSRTLSCVKWHYNIQHRPTSDLSIY